MEKRGLSANNAQFVSVDLIGQKKYQVILELTVYLTTVGYDSDVSNWYDAQAAATPSFAVNANPFTSLSLDGISEI